MESPKKKIDPTYYRKINTRSTFNHIFPQYTPKVKDFMSRTQMSFTSTMDFEKGSDFLVHNRDSSKRSHNKKIDRIVEYTESMLKIRDLVKINKK